MNAARATTTAISQGLNFGFQRCCGGAGTAVRLGYFGHTQLLAGKTFGSTDMPGRRR